MYIQPNQNNVNMYGSPKKPNFWKRIKQKALDVIPTRTFEDSPKKLEQWKKVDEFVSHPANNRLIMGATAILTQPAIDYCNHKVDKETREVSMCRTIAKILAGTLVGIVVRGSCYKMVEKMTNINGKSRISKSLLSPKYKAELIKFETFLKNHRRALSNASAILAMSVTNFLVDAPLTVFLTNHFNEKRQENKLKMEERSKINA